MSEAIFPELAGLLSEVLAGVLIAEPSFERLMAEDVVFEFPYAPDGFTRRIEGRAALTQYLTTVAGGIAIDQIHAGTVMVSPDHAMLEMHMKGHRRGDGQAYDQTYVAVIALAEGRITHYRDYWNPLPVLAASSAGALA